MRGGGIIRLWFLRGVIGILTASYTKVMNVNIKSRELQALRLPGKTLLFKLNEL